MAEEATAEAVTGEEGTAAGVAVAAMEVARGEGEGVVGMVGAARAEVVRVEMG